MFDFVPAIHGSEMRCRQDMYAFPPDILVTNFSMLQLMLARDSENGIWDKTREWIAASDEHIFWIVVDEIHTQRGTSGTEVGYLLRALKHQLGLDRYPTACVASGSAQAFRTKGQPFPSLASSSDEKTVIQQRHLCGRCPTGPRWRGSGDQGRAQLVSLLRDGDSPKPVSVSSLVRRLDEVSLGRMDPAPRLRARRSMAAPSPHASILQGSSWLVGMLKRGLRRCIDGVRNRSRPRATGASLLRLRFPSP